ncbi:hypothetical protein J6590_085374 [Homalodisca vitripennis]|nr:hypothetical protein J6590_085374 [Homalodisca vitripennis]
MANDTLRDGAVEEVLFGPWPLLEAALMGLPPPPLPPPVTHILPLQLMLIPQPRTLRITITPAQSPSGTSTPTRSSSCASYVVTLAPVRLCSSADRPCTSGRARVYQAYLLPTAEPKLDVSRERIRELILDHCPSGILFSCVWFWVMYSSYCPNERRATTIFVCRCILP